MRRSRSTATSSPSRASCATARSSPIGLLNLAMVSIGRGSTAPARGMLLEVLGIAEEIGSKPVAQSVFEVAAGLAASRDDGSTRRVSTEPRRRRHAQTGLRRDPTDEAFLAPFIAQARTALGTQAFAAAEADGAARAYDERRCRGARLARSSSR